MTEYSIEVGYNHDGASNAAEEKIWSVLKQVGLDIANNTGAIIDEASRCGAPAVLGADALVNYAVMLKARNDNTIQFLESNGESSGRIYLPASGGGDARTMKGHVRRAYCRLVVAEMHKRGYEVSMIVC